MYIRVHTYIGVYTTYYFIKDQVHILQISNSTSDFSHLFAFSH